MDLVKQFLVKMKQWYIEDDQILDLKKSIDSVLSSLEKSTCIEPIDQLLLFSQIVGEAIIDENRVFLERKRKAREGDQPKPGAIVQKSGNNVEVLTA